VVLAWNGVDLRLPSPRVELIGLHQSNNDGARDLLAIEGAPVPIVVMASRERNTGLQSAADIVLPRDAAVLAPVTGTVKRAGTYTLYCDNLDDFLVVEPDGHPGIEVKLLHISGVRVAAGDRVEAGVTVVAPGPTPLPFESQVDELSGPDDDPHVHLEVVDTSIPDEPNQNSGSDDC
jgi:murein DD-endopeptidase MepM/ murein hydrolase activator NlpD